MPRGAWLNRMDRNARQTAGVAKHVRPMAEDMGNTHGVYVNHSRIHQATPLSDGDEILLGQISLLFTTEDFEDRESALSHYKKVGERSRQTRME